MLTSCHTACYDRVWNFRWSVAQEDRVSSREIRRLRALKSPLQRGAIQLGLEVCIDSPCVRARNRKGFLLE